MFLQAVVGTAVAGVGALYLFWSNVRKTVDKIFKRDTESASDDVPTNTNTDKNNGDEPQN